MLGTSRSVTLISLGLMNGEFCLACHRLFSLYFFPHTSRYFFWAPERWILSTFCLASNRHFAVHLFSARLSIFLFRAPGSEYSRYFVGASLLDILAMWQDQNPGNSPHTVNTVSLVQLHSYKWLLVVSSAPTFRAKVDFRLPLRRVMQVMVRKIKRKYY